MIEGCYCKVLLVRSDSAIDLIVI